MTAVFGDFVRPAGEHIAAAVSIQQELTAEATFGVIGHFGRLLSTFVHYLDDLPVPDEFEAAMGQALSPEAQTVLDARIALRRGAQSLRHTMTALQTAVIDDAHPAAQHLSAAADFMAAGRDLLQTQFRHRPDRRPGRPLVLDTGHHLAAGNRCPARRNRGLRLATGAVDSAPVGDRDHAPGRPSRHLPSAADRQPQHMGRRSHHPGSATPPPPPPDARRLLGAIPANFPPPRQVPSSGEQIRDLCHGAVVTAERLRHATLAVARHARWSPAATSAAWRKHALAAAITSHASDLILRGLAERASQLATDPAICAQLQEAADATRRAWPTWRAIAHHFDIISTGINGRAGPDPVTAEFADLVLRIGRLAYRHPHWTPARTHASRTRNPAGLAPAPSDLTPVLAAVHAAAAEHRLYEPAFTRTNATVVRRRYRPACPPRADELLASYQDATEASTHATSKLENLAHALDAPTWPLAALRAQSQHSPRAFQPDETPAHRSPPMRPPAHKNISAGARI
jgi:hypothetical protein